MKQSTRLGSVAHGVRCFNVHHANIRWRWIDLVPDRAGGWQCGKGERFQPRSVDGWWLCAWSQSHQTPACEIILSHWCCCQNWCQVFFFVWII